MRSGDHPRPARLLTITNSNCKHWMRVLHLPEHLAVGDTSVSRLVRSEEQNHECARARCNLASTDDDAVWCGRVPGECIRLHAELLAAAACDGHRNFLRVDVDQEGHAASGGNNQE